MALVKIAVRSDLPACDTVKEVFVNGRFMCVVNVNGEIYVMDNVCPHWGGPLGQGTIQDGKIVCPWHGWTFDPKTGQTPRNANTRVMVYKVLIEGEDVFVELPECE